MVLKAVENLFGLPHIKSLDEAREVLELIREITQEIKAIDTRKARLIRDILSDIKELMAVKGDIEELKLVRDIIHDATTASDDKIREIRALIREAKGLAKAMPSDLAKVLKEE